MADYESLAHLSRWRRLVIAGLLIFTIPTFAHETGAQGVLYKCKDAAGATLYTATPAPGCVVVSTYRSAQPAQPAPRASYGSYSCTSDCSGHRAGYEWARNRGISDAYQCTGNSQSFIEGCRAFTEGHPGF